MMEPTFLKSEKVCVVFAQNLDLIRENPLEIRENVFLDVANTLQSLESAKCADGDGGMSWTMIDNSSPGLYLQRVHYKLPGQ